MGPIRPPRGPYGHYKALKGSLMGLTRLYMGSYEPHRALKGFSWAAKRLQRALMGLIRPSRGPYDPYKALKGLFWAI